MENPAPGTGGFRRRPGWLYAFHPFDKYGSFYNSIYLPVNANHIVKEGRDGYRGNATTSGDIRRKSNMENSGYFFAAFAIVWAVLFAYIFLLANRQRRLKNEVDSLKKRLTEK